MKNKLFKIVNIVFPILVIGFIIIIMQRHELGRDELDWTLGVVHQKTLGEILRELAQYGYNLPLYYIVVMVLDIFAHHNKFLLLLSSVIMGGIGCYYIYKISKEFFKENFSRLAIVLTVSSLFFYRQIICAVRPYSLLFMFSVLSTYYYLKKVKTNTVKNTIRYYLMITGLVLTHWYGLLLVFFYGINDLYLLIKKQLKFKSFILYIIPFALVTTWFIYIFNAHTTSFSNYWAFAPNIVSFVDLAFKLLGMNMFSILALYVLVKKLHKKIEKDQDYSIIRIMLVEILCFIAGVAIYSRFVNPKGSLWVNRYFITIMPQIMIVSSFYLVKLYHIAMTNLNNHTYKIFLKLLVFANLLTSIFFTGWYTYIWPDTELEVSYKKIYDTLKGKGDIYDEDTVIICTLGEYWVDYYLVEANKEKLPANILVIDTKKYGNDKQNDLAKISELEYAIKDFKRCHEAFNLDEFHYRKIYIMEVCRFMTNDEIKKLVDLEKYDSKYDSKIGVVELVRNEE